MKICIIYGNSRKENTYNSVRVVKEYLSEKEDIEYIEYFLPKDMPDFCIGCFNCFYNGKEKCPHSEYTMKIYNSMRDADGLIFASPVYVIDVTSQMKALLDHYGHMYMVHMPMEEMFTKSALIISTTAGAGTKYALDTIERSLKYWGVSKIFKCGLTVRSKKWDEIEENHKSKCISTLQNKANNFYKSLLKKKSPSLFVRSMFQIFVMAHKSENSIPIERKYWEEKGWLSGKKPWKLYK